MDVCHRFMLAMAPSIDFELSINFQIVKMNKR